METEKINLAISKVKKHLMDYTEKSKEREVPLEVFLSIEAILEMLYEISDDVN